MPKELSQKERLRRRIEALDELSALLGIKNTLSKSNHRERLQISRTLKFFTREPDPELFKPETDFYQRVLADAKKDGLSRWSQFSPWLKKDPDWKTL